MANKTFIVQYLIKARDHYSAAADKTRKSTVKMAAAWKRAKTAAASIRLGGLVSQVGALRRKFVALIPTMSSVTAAADRLKAASDRLEDRFEGLTFVGEKIRNTGAAMSAAITLPFLFAVNSMKNAARDAIETQSKFRTVFKDVSANAKASANDLAASYGLTRTKARQLLGDTGDILTGFGFTQKAALELSSKVNRLAVDLASFTNFAGGAEGASDALTKALLGEREALKSLGVAILDKDVKQKIATMLANGHRFATMRQAQAEATLALAVEQSKNAIGDFSRTQEDLANQERITSSRIQDLKESFGKILLPMALKVTKAVREMAVSLLALSPETKKFILIAGAALAVLGPLLLVLGAIVLSLPMLVAGFAIAKGAVLALLGPVGAVIAVLAALAFALVTNWQKISAFFTGFSRGVSETLGPALGRFLVAFEPTFKVLAALARAVRNTLSGLFGAGSETATALASFEEMGVSVGSTVGAAIAAVLDAVAGATTAVSTLITNAILGLLNFGSAVGALFVQTVDAITSLDFSKFDMEAVKAEFFGTAAAAEIAPTRVDVGVNVGLDKGLMQTEAAKVAGPAARRVDVGALPR